jgi:hypothetical protein
MRRNLPEKSRRGWNIGERLTEKKRGTNSMRIAQSARKGKGKLPAIKETIYTGNKSLRKGDRTGVCTTTDTEGRTAWEQRVTREQ